MRGHPVFRAGVLAACLVLVAAAAFSAGPAAEWRQTAVDGIEVFYQDSGPKDAPALLFIHGWACDSSFWQGQIGAFSGEYRCIALDLPGFGRSGKPRDAVYSPDLFARAVKAVADDAGARDVVLVGHSMGVAAARQFLVNHPGGAKAVANVDGAVVFFPEEPEARAIMEEMLADFALEFASGPGQGKAIAEFVETTFLGRTPENVREVVRRAMTAADPHACASSMAEFVKPEWWTPRTFDIPCLALYSDNPQEDPEIEDKLRGEFPGLTFAVWRDTGHFLMMERPGWFDAALREFLGAVFGK